jgi:aminoglycoside phosphotransferase family enzyme
VPIAFLQSPEAWRSWGLQGARVEVIQTRRSWVFLCGDRVLKLKKPVRERVLDFSTPALREHACREEVRLNDRLAPGVYLGVVALRRSAAGWQVDPEPDRHPTRAPADDWLVLMRRLPADRMLDQLIASGRAGQDEAQALAKRLIAFWRAAPAVPLSTTAYVQRMRDEMAISLALLRQAHRALPGGIGRLRRLTKALRSEEVLLGLRAQAGRIVDGHGDLRPEHVCMPPHRPGSNRDDGVLVIDALEFEPRLRAVDPLDELAYFALECGRLGAPSFGRLVAWRCMRALGDRQAVPVLRLYTALRALLRARLAMAHLDDIPVRDPARWRPLATWYLDAAETALGRPG